jgi:hypothetical protein
MGSPILRRCAAAFAIAALVAIPAPSRAAIETDPLALYATMRQAYDEGAAKGWPFAAEAYYQTTVFDAGRSYALFKPTDAQYAEVAGLAVDVATQMHYNPLTNDDASEWYVREACVWVQGHSDPDRVAKASALLARLMAGDRDPVILSDQAEDDASEVAKNFHRDADSLVQVIVADVRAYNLTKNAKYRSLLLQHAADPALPLVRVPNPESLELFAIATQAGSAVDAAFSEADRANAKLVVERRRRTPELQVIGRVKALPHTLRLTHTAPADEYFGNSKLSPIGVGNEIIRINRYLDAGWGDRMASDALLLVGSIQDWQHQYPHDATLPRHLYDVYRLLRRVDAAATQPEAEKMRMLLLVQYANSPQARDLAAS